MRAAGMGEASRVGERPGLDNAERERSASLLRALARRRLRGRASGSRPAGARVLDDDSDDARRFGEGIIRSGAGVAVLARRPRTSGRNDDVVKKWASDRESSSAACESKSVGAQGYTLQQRQLAWKSVA